MEIRSIFQPETIDIPTACDKVLLAIKNISTK
jgi:hypothetical protein